MTLADIIKKAIDTDDAALAGRIADRLRFRQGMTYQQILELVQTVRPDVTPALWETLMYESDGEEQA